MRKQYSRDELLARYQKLPDILKDALFSTDGADALNEIGEKAGLDADGIAAISEETGLVIFGLTHPKDFISNLTERLGEKTDLARSIAHEINARIFLPLRQALHDTHDIDVGEIQTPLPQPQLSRPQEAVAPQQQTLPSQRPAPSAVPPPRPREPQPPQRPQPIPQQPPSPKSPQMPHAPALRSPAPPDNLPASKIPPIDLRKQMQGVMPPQPGRDPYRETIG